MSEQELQQAFLQFLAQKSGAKNQKDLEKYVKSLGEKGLEKAYQEFQQTLQNQTQKAKHGAKLNYLNKLKNKCAEGEELVYYKKGGSVDCGCVKKEDNGGKTPQKPKKSVEKFKMDRATRDSIAANEHDDQEVQANMPGKYIPNPKHDPKDPKSHAQIWVPDRTQAPYKKDEKKVEKKACGSKVVEKFKNRKK